MIKTDRQYKLAQAKCQEGAEQLNQQVDGMKDRGYSEHEIQCLTGCTARMLAQSCQAVELYRRLKDRDVSALQGLPINRQLIALRIFLGISQAELASRLGIARAEVVRDEKNEYPDLTVQRYHQLLQAMGLYHIPVYCQGDWRAAQELRGFLAKIVQEQGSSAIIG